MSRNFPSFLDAYLEYADDSFCPRDFHLWTGLSIIAAALERKVWMEQDLGYASIMHYPNIYALLVSHPGVGKSTAMDRGVDLLEQLKEYINPDFKIVPNQATEPALIDLMKLRGEIRIGSTIFFHSSGFFYASEASASALQNLYGDFNATLTAFYDCPKWFRKKTKGEREMVELPNVCFNLLAGCTFDYLKKLVNEESVMGGLASRFIYVISKERKVRQSRWHQGKIVPKLGETTMRERLIEDLDKINKLVGRVTPTPEFIARWEKEQPEFDQFLIDLDSPRMESLYARRFTNLMKVCILLCVSEGDSLVLTEDHWVRAKRLIEDVTKDNAFVVSSAMMADKTSQSGTNQTLGQLVKKAGGTIETAQLKQLAFMNGNPVALINETLEYMVNAGLLAYVDGAERIKLLVDPDSYL